MFGNSDEFAGYQAGLRVGRIRIAGHLYDRHPPEHLSGRRAADWREGYRAGLAARKARRIPSIVEYTVADIGFTERMHGTRREIVDRLAALGAAGDVFITTPAGKRHRCGI